MADRRPPEASGPAISASGPAGDLADTSGLPGDPPDVSDRPQGYPQDDSGWPPGYTRDIPGWPDSRPRRLPGRPPGGARRRRGTSWLNLMAAVLIGTGIVIAFVGHDTLRWSPPPIPPAWAAGHPGEPPRHLVNGQSRAAAYRLRRSAPVSIDIPAIKVRARVISLGLGPGRSIGVPSLRTPFLTAWYDRGPAPGSPGASVILGHVDAAGVGPAVFYYLGNVRPGNRIYVRLRNGRTAIFEAYSVALYLKTRFPTARVYGYTSWPTLRLVTCGGDFDPRTGHYLGNTVVFASYVGQRAAT